MANSARKTGPALSDFQASLSPKPTSWSGLTSTTPFLLSTMPRTSTSLSKPAMFLGAKLVTAITCLPTRFALE